MKRGSKIQALLYIDNAAMEGMACAFDYLENHLGCGKLECDDEQYHRAREQLAGLLEKLCYEQVLACFERKTEE